MTAGLQPNLIVQAIHLLSAVFAIHAWLQLRKAARVPGMGPPLAVVIGCAFAFGAFASFHPALVGLRENLFIGQPLMIFTTAAFCLLAGLTAVGRRYFTSVDIWPIMTLYGWRAVFGAGLMVLGLSGGLPAGFFWSAALGDIAVGLWALWIVTRGDAVSRGELIAWNIAGLADLLHVLVLGALHLAAFYGANPGVARLGLLPIFGVPLFIALHIHLFRALRVRQRIELSP